MKSALISIGTTLVMIGLFIGAVFYFAPSPESLGTGLRVLTVSQGGTGWANLESGTLLTGNGTTRIATTTVGSGLSLSGGTLSATAGSGDPFPFTDTGDGTGEVSTSTVTIFSSGLISKASTTFEAAVVGISLDEIEDPTTDKTFTLGSSNLDFQFTTASAGILFQATGAFSGDLVKIQQSTGNPGATDLLFLSASDADVDGLHINLAGGRAIDIKSSSDSYTAGDWYISGNDINLGNGTATSTISGTATSTWQGGASFAGLATSLGLDISAGELLVGSAFRVLNDGTIVSTVSATSTFSGGLDTAGLASSAGVTITGGQISCTNCQKSFGVFPFATSTLAYEGDITATTTFLVGYAPFAFTLADFTCGLSSPAKGAGGLYGVDVGDGSATSSAQCSAPFFTASDGTGESDVSFTAGEPIYIEFQEDSAGGDYLQVTPFIQFSLP